MEFLYSCVRWVWPLVCLQMEEAPQDRWQSSSPSRKAPQTCWIWVRKLCHGKIWQATTACWQSPQLDGLYALFVFFKFPQIASTQISIAFLPVTEILFEFYKLGKINLNTFLWHYLLSLLTIIVNFAVIMGVTLCPLLQETRSLFYSVKSFTWKEVKEKLNRSMIVFYRYSISLTLLYWSSALKRSSL